MTHSFAGGELLNQWFRRHAWRNRQGGMPRTSVVCDSETGAIVGYVALSASQIEGAHLPRSAQRNRPDPVSAILFGRLAIDRRYHGMGYARSLMLYVLTTAARLSKEMGCLGVLTHPIDDEVWDFHGRFGFEALPFDPERSRIMRIVDLEGNGL